MKNCFAGHSMQKIRTTPLHRRKRAKEEGLRGSGSVASGMYTIYDIPCLPPRPAADSEKVFEVRFIR